MIGPRLDVPLDETALTALVAPSLVAAAVLGLLGGIVGVMVMRRDLAFAVHGISELSFAGGAAGLLLGVDAVVGSIGGSLLAAVVLGFVGVRARDRNSVVGVLMPTGLGIGILLLTFLPEGDAHGLELLAGELAGIGDPGLGVLAVVAVVVLVALALLWRPLAFASLDPEVARARGVPERALSVAFLLLLGLVTAVAVQLVGALLVLALLVTPAAAALRVASSTAVVIALAAVFGIVSAGGGVLVAVAGTLPVSPFVTMISFLIYVGCRAVEAARRRVP
ncbi:metal ABC transporter permease [Pseudolysinimonas sp.]